VLVEADEADDPWPSRRFLRQGVRANGWVLLNIVPLGYEFWRQFNGFPPVIAPDEPGAAVFNDVVGPTKPTGVSSTTKGGSQ
jgi:hypothetical protein